MPRILTFLIACAAFLSACSPTTDTPATGSPVAVDADPHGHVAPSEQTIAANAALAEALSLDDHFDDPAATRGFVAKPDELDIRNANGDVVWRMSDYAFVDDASNSINPSLQRQARLNNHYGLFKVTEGIYQLRGFDLSNMTLIESDNGWIIVDPLTARETAKAAIEFARATLGDKPIKAVLFTHSHLDHFGGVLGVLDEESIKSGSIPIYAPAGFFEEATSENIIAGVAMGRRAMYMYGQRLSRSERGHVGSGLGKSPAFGRFGILEPDHSISENGERATIDGVEFVFQNVSGSEAPSEFVFYLPKLKAYCGAELVSRNMHNLYTLRGAKVRDALVWSDSIDVSLQMFPEAEIYFGSHHWPVWGKRQVADFLSGQRDLYKYIHDQSVRLANSGLGPGEIAEQIKLPDALEKSFANRGYYGTLKHNARAVYQFYFGWYDAHPSNLDPLPQVEAAKLYVEAMGGKETVTQLATSAYDNGQYRWSAELLRHAVFAAPEDASARELLARSFDQLAYQAESGPWRDVYLSGAYELRHGAPKSGPNIADSIDILVRLPVARLFETMSVRLNPDAANGKTYRINFVFTDIDTRLAVVVHNSVMHSYENRQLPEPDATMNVTHAMFLKLLGGQVGITRALLGDELSIEGSKLALGGFFKLFDKPNGVFPIVTP
ncbi:MAG: alkyl sulfatase dimerization domain-containing protein [Pseudomonadota bacterium]